MKKDKYNFSDDIFGIHHQILQKATGVNSILDVGCASGYLGKRIFKRGVYLLGIDKDKQSISKARKYYSKLIIGDIENTKILQKIGNKKFNVIILADILEHLKDPYQMINKIKRYLNKEGELVISVPNIGFLTYRLLHLFGKFEYSDWGIMDKTHLHFFTKSSIIQMLKENGLGVEEFNFVGNFTQLPLFMQTLYPLVGKFKWFRNLEYRITSFWPEGLATQFLLVCKINAAQN